MDSIWTNGSWQVVTTSNDFLFHYFILSISLSLVLSYSSNGTQFISLSSIIDKVQRKGGPLIKNRFQTTMLADGGPPLFFSLMKPASHYGLKSKGKNLSLFRCLPLCSKVKKKAAFFFFFFYLSRGRRAWGGTTQQRWWNEEKWT